MISSRFRWDRYRTLIFFFTLCVLPQIVAIGTYTELFPWSPFPMYSGVIPRSGVTVVSAYFVEESGTEVPVEKILAMRPRYEYRFRLDSYEVWNRGLKEEEKQILRSFGEILSDDFTNQKLTDNVPALRFYIERWENFSGSRRRNPDDRRMLYEHISVP
jgi:hypothetical protein